MSHVLPRQVPALISISSSKLLDENPQVTRYKRDMLAPEINISSVPHIVPVTRNSCRLSVYDILLKFENLPVIVTVRKRILLVTYEIVPDSDQ